MSFFYNSKRKGKRDLIIYWDLVLVINFVFDFTLLLTVDTLLKRRAKKRRLLLASFVGEISMISLWVNFGNVGMFFFKIGLNVLMVVCAFSYRDVRYTFYNAIYLYLVGIILGGFEQYLYNEFNIGGKMGVRYLIVVLLSPLVLIFYSKLSKLLKNNYNNRHALRILYEGGEFQGVGYLDSGNKLVSPISGKTIILVEKEYIVYHKLKLVPVPYTALNYKGLLYCFKPDALFVDGVKKKDVLVGLSEVKFNIEGCNALLNARMEDL